MSLYIKQKVFSWGDKFSVYDENGNEKYYVEGAVFSFGKKLHVYNRFGEEVAFIEQKLFTFLPRYSIMRGGRELLEVVKEFTFFHPRYTVTGMNWTVSGDFFDHDYEITASGNVIASVSKEWMTWGDTYQIQIALGVDEITVLAVAIIIDACLDAKD